MLESLIATVGWNHSAGFVVIAAVTVFIAYIVFGATGFGATVLSVPILAHWLPLTFVVPLVCLFDLAASGSTGARKWREIDRAEFFSLLPYMLIGMVLGMGALVYLPAKWMLGALGVFVLFFGLYNLYNLANRKATSRWKPLLGVPFGLIGGIFSAAFGTGGLIYNIYLSRRIESVSTLRSTMATIVSLSALIRFVGFLFGGLLLQPGLLPLAAALALPMLCGVWAGHKLHDRLPRERVLQLIAAVLVVNGVMLVLRAMG